MEFYDSRRMHESKKYSLGYEKQPRKVEAYSRTLVTSYYNYLEPSKVVGTSHVHSKALEEIRVANTCGILKKMMQNLEQFSR